MAHITPQQNPVNTAQNDKIAAVFTLQYGKKMYVTALHDSSVSFDETSYSDSETMKFTLDEAKALCKAKKLTGITGPNGQEMHFDKDMPNLIDCKQFKNA